MTFYSSGSISSSVSSQRCRPQTTAYIYGPPANNAPITTPSHLTTQRYDNYSITRPAPSPLRYPTHNGVVMRSFGDECHELQLQPDDHAQPGLFYRWTSNKNLGPATQKPLYSSSLSTSSSRSSLSQGRGSTASSMPSKTAPRRRVRFQLTEPRPPRGDSGKKTPVASVYQSHVQRSPTFHMHPIFAQSHRLQSAPISYDVTYAPSTRTVFDRSTNTLVDAQTLLQLATDPPTATSARLILRSDKLPWPVVVGPSNVTCNTRSRSGHCTTTSSPTPSNAAITNLDILNAVHRTLLMNVTTEEWNSLGHESRLQRRVAEAYERRCTRLGGGWEGGVRRIDWLGRKTRLVGVEVEKGPAGGRIGKLVFGKA